jgi:hypothetical protein
VVALFAFLASDEAAYITEHSYVIDGGETAGGISEQIVRIGLLRGNYFGGSLISSDFSG